MKTVALCGSTGSIGTQTLDVVRACPEAYRVSALAAGSRVGDVLHQVLEFRPDVVVMGSPEAAGGLQHRLAEHGGPLPAIDHGSAALAAMAATADVVVNAVVGFAGLPVTIAALSAGRRLALANKESLIAAGPVVQAVRRTPGAELLPVDSEHCALHQCLRSNEALGGSGRPDRVERLVLTASGGPFRGRRAEELASVTIEDALAHPTWAMGPKITVDSSTLMNKGLEVIEAHELYGVGYDRIEVVVHPQSVVHSMVEFTDGATMAQLSLPDMRLCIGYALAYPDRLAVPYGRIDWPSLTRLDFEAPDLTAFPCLTLAYDAGRLGGTAPAWLNAANEVAVAAFLDGALAWNQIPVVLRQMLDRFDGTPAESADVVIATDRRAREETRRLLRSAA
jgi:1-deoxy-D-xylulose-5-phosphate reductoisomerase